MVRAEAMDMMAAKADTCSKNIKYVGRSHAGIPIVANKTG